LAQINAWKYLLLRIIIEYKFCINYLFLKFNNIKIKEY
jgi:hypothetical protein